MIILQQARGLLSSGDQCSLDLPFAETKSITARVGPTPAFTRASTATFVGSNGLIQTAAVNSPRFDHTAAGVCRGLLIEESRTNLLSRSEDLANSTWIKFNSSISGTLYTAPTGASTANELVEDSLNAAHTCVQYAAVATIGTTYTFSVFVKRKPSSNQFLLIGATNLVVASFLSVNLTNGVISTGIGSPQVPINVSSTAYPDGWYRVQFSVVATSAAAITLDIRLSRDGTWANRSYLGDGVQSSLVWGAQVEAGAFATSYIPTTTGTLARSADVCSISGANFSGMWNQSEGTLLTQTQKTSTSSNAFVISASDNSFNNETDLRYNSVSQVASLMNVSNVNQLSGLQANITSGAAVKQSIAYKLNDCAYSVNGATPILDASALIPTVSQITIGNAFSGNFHLNGHIAAIRYYRKRLPNAKLQTLTT